MTEKWTEDKEYMSYVEDLLATEEVQRLGNYIQHMNSTRLEHSISVFLLQLQAGKKNGMVMLVRLPEQGCYMTCFTMTGVQQNLMRDLMLTCIRESR